MRDCPFIRLVHRGPSDGEKDPAGDILHERPGQLGLCCLLLPPTLLPGSQLYLLYNEKDKFLSIFFLNFKWGGQTLYILGGSAAV
jgi:hypothetical protein